MLQCDIVKQSMLCPIVVIYIVFMYTLIKTKIQYYMFYIMKQGICYYITCLISNIGSSPISSSVSKLLHYI